MLQSKSPIRKSSQYVIPAQYVHPPAGVYDIYPAHPLPDGAIEAGFDALARRLAGQPAATIDGYIGVLWEDFRERLTEALSRLGLKAHWHPIDACLRPDDEIERLTAPFLGGDDPLFGTRFTGSLSDFFDMTRAASLPSTRDGEIHIVYGCGAALAGWDAPLVYLDVPKNEIQFRSRAGCVKNLGARTSAPPKEQYKRFYFVDWIALNRHKAELATRIDLLIDVQREDEPLLMAGKTWRRGLGELARSAFRVRPWFEPGPWGGQWIREKIQGLNPDVPNYAWSFELITPENGIVFESDGLLLECAFDWLMILEGDAVLGEYSNIFRDEFPIRFDFLDTVRGGNLSLQCHPRPRYIQREFGERFTQDETYYILDAEPGAEVFLGFCDGVDPEEFEQALQRSYAEGKEFDARRFVQVHPARRGDLFLIPNGTIHCSGVGSLVLEISATPYIFTFKMYDWQRMDLDGKPRPLNIERAMDNLHFERQGGAVRRDLIARPRTMHDEPGVRIEHLATHPDHFYDVERVRFSKPVELATDGSPQVMSLVEGANAQVEAGGRRRTVSFAETFVVPAAAERFRLLPIAGREATVVRCHLKRGYPWEGYVV